MSYRDNIPESAFNMNDKQIDQLTSSLFNSLVDSTLVKSHYTIDDKFITAIKTAIKNFESMQTEDYIKAQEIEVIRQKTWLDAVRESKKYPIKEEFRTKYDVHSDKTFTDLT